MKKQIAKIQIVSALLWAAAMIAAAIVHAPSYFTLGVLPSLAMGFLLVTESIGRSQDQFSCNERQVR